MVADVAFTAIINNDKNKITIDPSSDLDNSTTYWYGVVDGAIEYSTDTPVTWCFSNISQRKPL